MLRLNIFGTFRVADASGDEIPIKSRKSRALLAYLALPPGKPRSREQIMALLWSDRDDQHARSSLRQALSGLRRDLGEEDLSALRITDESLTLDSAHVIVEPATPGDVLLDGLHLTDPAFEEWLRDERLRQENIAPPDTTPTGPPLPENPSIAVLPFTNMSADPEQEFFSDGITEDIITALSKIGNLLVVARNSTFAYKGQAVDVKKVSREQGVRYVLGGSVRKAGSRIRVTTQLIDAMTGHHLWAERYDRDLDDIFAVQDEITREVVVALDVRLSAGEQARFWSSSTKSLEAWESVRLGMDLLNRGTPEALRDAKPLCQKALDLDPKYTMAWVMLGWTHHHEIDAAVGFAFEGSREARIKAAMDCAERALKLDPECADAYSLLSFCCLSNGQHDQALAMAEKAVVLAPNNADILATCAITHNKSGQPGRGLELIRKAMRLCPIYSGWFLWVLGSAYRLLGQPDKAVEAFKAAIERNQDFIAIHVSLASLLGELGRREEAKAPVTEILRLSPNFSIKSYVAGVSYRDPAEITRLEDGLRKAGLPT